MGRTRASWKLALLIAVCRQHDRALPCLVLKQPCKKSAGHGVQLLLGHQASHEHVHTLSDFPKLNYADIGDAVMALRTHVSSGLLQSADLLESLKEADISTIETGTPGMFRALATGISRLHTEVANHTQFAPRLRDLADKCIERMTTGVANATYWGLHLRVEDDFGATARLGGGSPPGACGASEMLHAGALHHSTGAEQCTLALQGGRPCWSCTLMP